MSEAGEKPIIKSPGIPQSILSEITQMENKFDRISPEQRLGVVAVNPFRVLGFNDVEAINLRTVPDKDDIKLACDTKERDLFAFLVNPIAKEKEKDKERAIITWIMLPEIRVMTIMLSNLARSSNSDDQKEARRIIKLFNDNRDNPRLGFAEMEKKFAEQAKKNAKH